MPWFELEALCSLTNFAYLNPGYTFPRFVLSSGEKQPPVFATQALGHPLIPEEHKVVNDFALSESNEMVLLEKLKVGASQPIFFLIDEIFKGTNNEERLIGSSAYIHALAGHNCVGVISTHDLELVKLADVLPMLKNYHFREAVQDGQLIFDYQLHHGPCPTRNALKIMQLAGLPVSWDEQSRPPVKQPEQLITPEEASQETQA